MSQSTFLEEVVTWDQEKRIEKVDEAIPRLVSILQTYSSFEEAVGILQIVCQSFVPIIHHEQLEQQIFGKISQQICCLLDDVLETIHRTWQNHGKTSDSEHLMSLLQAMLGILECTVECVQHVAGLHNTVQLLHIKSLPRCALHVLKGSYGHCKESSDLYGDFLPKISDFLSAIFRKAHSLQMIFLNLLNKLDPCSGGSTGDSQELLSVCDGLFSLCNIVALLDLKLTLSIWKAILRIANQHQGILSGSLDISSMIGYLCGEMHSGIENLLQAAQPEDDQETLVLSQGDEKTFTRALKILSFQMKVVVTMVKDYQDCLDNCISSIYRLMLNLYSVLPPCLSAPRIQVRQQEEIRHLLKGVYTLSCHLLSNTTLRDCLSDHEDTPEEYCLPRLLLQIMILDNLVQCSEEQEDIWFQRHMMSSGLVASHYHTLLSAIFRSLELCHVEVCLPVYLPSSTHIDSPQRYVSLYQYVLNHICEYLKCRSDRVFKAANKELLSVLLKMHPTSSLAAADCLYFIARSGPTALRWHYAHLLMTLNQEFHKAMPVGHPISSLSSLVSRVINLLTSDQQVKLLSVFPPSDNISLWVDVNLDNMAPGSAGEAVEVLVPCCLKTLHNFRQQTTPTISNAAIVIPSLKCLENILRHGQTASLLTPQQGAMVLELVSALWRSCPIEISFTDQSSKGQDVTQLYLAELLSVTSCIVDQLETKLLFKILQIINKAVKGSPSDGFVLTVVHLLQHLGPVKIPPSFEQGQMLRKIADTFATVLSHQRAEVRHCAMVAFTKFAEQTSHEAVVPECLAQQEGLKDRMVAFLQEIPHNHENRKFDTIAFLRKQKQDLQRKMTEDFNSYTGPQLLSVQSMEPLKKRQRQDTGPANQAELFQAALLKLEEAAAMFEEAERQGSIPDSVKTSSSLLIQRLSTCLSSRQ